MGYRVTVVNPTGFPLTAESDDEGRVKYRPKIGGKRVTVFVPDDDADILRDQHDQAVLTRHQRALGIREDAKRKRQAAAEKARAEKAAKKTSSKKKTSSTKKATSKKTSSKKKATSKKLAPHKPASNADGTLKYVIATQGPKKDWPKVQGAPVGEHFAVHKRDDGKFSLTHVPTGHAIAVGRSKKRLVEVGETMTSLLGKVVGTRTPATLASKIQETKNLGWWVRELASGKTTVRYADYRGTGIQP